MYTLTFYKGDQIALGLKTEKGILDVERAANVYSHINDVPLTVSQLICNGKVSEDALLQLEEDSCDNNDLFLSEETLMFGPSVPDPEKIICVGLNYKRHADECNMAYPEEPILFSKFQNTLSAHQSEIEIPEFVEQMDYEAELAIVIGKEAKNVSEEDALSFVYGYCNGNDLSARELQFKSSQWLLGKSCDGFCPIGPYLVSKQAISDPNKLSISLSVNGVIKQESSTSDMIFNCSQIISYISRHMTLKPGDIILTGTPEGVIVGESEDKRTWLKSGDVVTVAIEQLGALKTTFK